MDVYFAYTARIILSKRPQRAAELWIGQTGRTGQEKYQQLLSDSWPAVHGPKPSPLTNTALKRFQQTKSMSRPTCVYMCMSFHLASSATLWTPLLTPDQLSLRFPPPLRQLGWIQGPGCGIVRWEPHVSGCMSVWGRIYWLDVMIEWAIKER